MKPPLDQLADRLGIATRYLGATGEWVEVAPSTVRAVATSLGFDASSPASVEAALADLDAEDRATIVEPVIVAWDGLADPVSVLARSGRSAVVLTDEAGTDLTESWLAGQALPFGYLDLDVGGGAGHATVISAPIESRPMQAQRKLGLFAPLFALRPAEPRHPDLRELEELADWVAEHGGDTVMTLPLLAGFFDTPGDHSPYSPASRIMWNELYAVVERSECDLVEPIDYPAMFESAHAGLAQVARSLEADPVRSAEFLRFLAERPEVLDYARFRAAGEVHGRDWRRWPEALRHGTIDPTAVDATRVRDHAVAQWVIDSQITELGRRLTARGVTLALDLAVGTHPLGFDVWADQSRYVSGCAVGAPPDDYFPGGQSWGFPPPDPRMQRRSAHQSLRDTLRFHLRVASLLRIDHVMALMRLYWIPDGHAPDAGTYVASCLDEQLAVVCLEAHRARATIVGENLGLVPDEIDDAIEQHRFLGMAIATGPVEQPELAAQPVTAPSNTVAGFGTHDMATFVGLIHGDDLADRVALGFDHRANTAAIKARRSEAFAIATASRSLDAHAPDAEGIAALYRVLSTELAETDAELVILALEDLWGERLPLNVPGTSHERPNWLRRCAYALSAIPGPAAATFEQAAAARRAETTGPRRAEK